MKTINLSGFKQGDNLNISVSQGAITAGPVGVPAWGGTGTGGTISLTTNRPHFNVAPESVRFWVDLSSSDFDAPGPDEGKIYDPRYHDLIYLWDFDDTEGDWTAPEKVLPAWKNRNTAKGPFVAHMYTQPGTYNPSVLVIEPSSGKTATATIEITVRSMVEAYDPAHIIYVSTSGDFTGAVPGAQTAQIDTLIDTTPIWVSNRVNPVDGNAPKKLWLFRAGEEFDVQVLMDGYNRAGQMFGSYGAGARPILRHAKTNTSWPMFYTTAGYGQMLPTNPWTPGVIRWVGLDCRGEYDPTSYTPGTQNSGTFSFHNMGQMQEALVSDCRFSGFEGSTFGTGFAKNEKSTKSYRYHLDDCVLTDFGGQYPFIVKFSELVDSSVTLTGCRFAQNPNALDNMVTRSPFRCQFVMNTHLRGCDFFHVDSSQPAIKLITAPTIDGALVNMHSCSIEGGDSAITVASTAADGLNRTSAHNVILDGNIFVGSVVGDAMYEIQASGVTIRNSLFVQPGIGAPYLDVTRWMVTCNRNSPVGESARGEPIFIYNNTFRVDRSSSQNRDKIPVVVDNSMTDPWRDVRQANNVIHAPNLNAPLDAFSPLTDTPMWTARSLGYRPHVARSGGEYWNVDVPHGATITVPWYTLTDGTLLNASYFAGTNSDGALILVRSGGERVDYYEVQGHISYGYSVSGLEVTNLSGVTWVTTDGLTFLPDMGSTAPMQTAFATPAGAVKDSKPEIGSAALGAALTGNVSYMDILGTTRTAPADKGAWKAA